MDENRAILFAEREKRISDTIALRVPDRVPILVFFGFFPARYAGMTVREFMYDPEKIWQAETKTMADFQPDAAQNPYLLRYLGPILETLDFKQLIWPGHGLTSDHTYQFIEGEYMKAEEYDAFLSDPTDFMVRRYWPRICGKLQGLEQLPPLHNIISYYMGIPTGFGAFSLPEVIEALETLKAAGQESTKIRSYVRKFAVEMEEAGFPVQFGGICQAPYDTLGDFFRGTKGIMLDMYRRPEKLIKACEKILPFMFEMAVAGTKNSGNPRVFIPIHKGLDGFMSLEQFKKFFWPTLRDLMAALINEGLVPCPLWEGDCASRLDTIKDIPPGKACYALEATDIAKAKEVLRDRVCIRGNLPLSILATGTPNDVRDYCKKLIDIAAPGGGYIMDASTGLDDAKPENVKAMFEYTKEYGVY